jgi:hypothetical protein
MPTVASVKGMLDIPYPMWVKVRAVGLYQDATRPSPGPGALRHGRALGSVAMTMVAAWTGYRDAYQWAVLGS